MDWVHPADAMRAKIEGKLNCWQCRHMLKSLDTWCLKQKEYPDVVAHKYACREFQRHRDVDKSG